MILGGKVNFTTKLVNFKRNYDNAIKKDENKTAQPSEDLIREIGLQKVTNFITESTKNATSCDRVSFKLLNMEKMYFDFVHLIVSKKMIHILHDFLFFPKLQKTTVTRHNNCICLLGTIMRRCVWKWYFNRKKWYFNTIAQLVVYNWKSDRASGSERNTHYHSTQREPPKRWLKHLLKDHIARIGQHSQQVWIVPNMSPSLVH